MNKTLSRKWLISPKMIDFEASACALIAMQALHREEMVYIVLLSSKKNDFSELPCALLSSRHRSTFRK